MVSTVLAVVGLVQAALVGAAWDDSNFFDWFQEELREAEDVPLVFEGEVPDYIRGTFIQTGPGRFSFGKTKFTHMMDGYSKTNTIHFSNEGPITYTSKFLESAFMNDSIKNNVISRGLFVGGIDPDPHYGGTSVLGPNDNNYIKMRKLGDQAMILADTMIATKMEPDFVKLQGNIRSQTLAAITPGQKWDDNLEPFGDMCMLGTMAHAQEDKNTGVFTGAMGCFGASGNYHIAFNLSPEAVNKRKLLAKIDLPKGRSASYMHTMASTPNYIVLIAEPLYMALENVLQGKPLGEGSLFTNQDDTLFQIITKATGEVRTVNAPGFIFGHLLNSWEENGDIVMDMTWYEANNATTLGWMNRWFLKYMQDVNTREEWPRASIMRYRLFQNGTFENHLLFEDENGEDDFETPALNEQFMGLPYCISYLLQFHSYDYATDKSSIVGGPMGAVGIAKRNVCTGERNGWYTLNHYPSEVEFIGKPGASAEDEGSLVGIVFDGNTNSSYVQILDAQTLEQVAHAALPIRSPFLIHSSFFPEN